MKEDLLHYVWRMQLFNRHELCTTTGLPIEILHPGFLNTHAGPDFLNAHLRIGNIIWAGNVEMHLKASDWIKHNHQADNAYDNVILHVVLEEDVAIQRSNQQALPCLEMKKRISPKLHVHYQRLLNNEYWIPCETQLSCVKTITKDLWLNRLVVERLEDKSLQIQERLHTNTGDWETTFYQFLSRSIGNKVNAEPMEYLARKLPLNIISKHQNSLFQLEALLFGQAGFLDKSWADDYPQQLNLEYRFLQKKYSLSSIPVASWKFLRLRPANFPTIRIAQLATLLYQTRNIFSKIIAAENIKELENLFDIKLSNYWWKHYNFDKLSSQKKKALGKRTIHHIIINTVAPFLFTYGKNKGNTAIQDKALNLLELADIEDNKIIRQWSLLGIKAKSAQESQALIQLKNKYCNHKDCLRCAIGNAILTKKQ